jgi:hypothetical protein
MKLLCSIIGFLCVVWLGYLASLFLLEAYESDRPYLGETPSDERSEKIKKHQKKMSFKAGACCGVIWMIWFWWSRLSTI